MAAEKNTEFQFDNKSILALGAIALAFFGGRAIFKKLGVVKNEQDIKDEAIVNQMLKEDYFNPSYADKALIKYGAIQGWSGNSAEILAKQIYDAKGIFNDDEEAVYSVFRKCQYKTQVSRIAKAFLYKYNADLYSYINPNTGFLSNNEMMFIVSILNKLPMGVKIGGVWQ